VLALGAFFGALLYGSAFYVLFLIARIIRGDNHFLQKLADEPGYSGPSFRRLRFWWLVWHIAFLAVLQLTIVGCIVIWLSLLGAIPWLIGYAIHAFQHAQPETRQNVLVSMGLLAFTWTMAHTPYHDGINGGMVHPAPGVGHAGDPVTNVPPTHQVFGNNYQAPARLWSDWVE
jgi:hypothetical protein